MQQKKNVNFIFILSGLLALSMAFAFFLYHGRPFQKPLGSFLTDLSGRTAAQKKNITRASSLISGTILQADETFSFNQVAGPYTLDRGFVTERSFQGHQTVSTPGGGICQVSSTLYNAAQLAKLMILERVEHSQAVQSVPLGLDATVAYGVADLKFKNPYSFPIQIFSRIDHEQLKIEIWGQEKPNAN